MCANHFDDPYLPGNAFSITPLLQYSSTPVLLWFKSRAPFGGKPKPGPLGQDSLLFTHINKEIIENMANQVGKRYVCTVCGAEFIVTRGGDGELHCCGKKMEIKK